MYYSFIDVSFLQGQSVCLNFTTLLDDGLNYCNLYNLLSGERTTQTTWIVSSHTLLWVMILKCDTTAAHTKSKEGGSI